MPCRCNSTADFENAFASCSVNAIAFNQDDYIELLAIHDPAEHQAAGRPGTWDADLARFIAAGGGIRYIILQSDDLAAEVAAMRSRGVDVGARYHAPCPS